MKLRLILCALLAAGTASAVLAQTPPVQPNVSEVPLPGDIAVPPPAKQAEETNHPLTADEAAKIAIHYQQSLAAAQASVLAAKGQLQQAKAGLYPTLVATGSYTRSETFRPAPDQSPGTGSSSSSPGFVDGLAVKQLIFDFNHTRDVVHQSGALAGVSQLNYTKAVSDLVYQVKQGFYTYVQNEHLVTVNQANVTNTTYQLALAKARLNVGVGQPADLVQAETNLANAQQALVQARATASASRATLALLMGLDPRTPIVAGEDREPIAQEDDMNALTDQALKQRPEILAAATALDAARFGYRAALTQDAPVLSLNLSATGRGTRDPLNTSGGSAGISLSWPIDDGGVQAGSIKIAKASIQTANANQTIVAQQVVNDVTQAWLQLKSALARKVITAAQVQNALEGVRIAQGRYEAGLGTFIDVTTAQALLVTAQTNDVSAATSIDLARAALSHATGRQVR